MVIAQDSSSCCPYGLQAFRCFAKLFRVGSLDQLPHAFFAQRLARRLAVQQVDHDFAEREDLTQGSPRLPVFERDSRPRPAAPARPQDASTTPPVAPSSVRAGPPASHMRILKVGELGSRRPDSQLLRLNAAVAAAVGMRVAVLLPQQLKGEVLVGGQLLLQGGEIGQVGAALGWPGWRRPRRAGGDVVVAPVVRQGPGQLGGVDQFPVLVDGWTERGINSQKRRSVPGWPTSFTQSARRTAVPLIFCGLSLRKRG